MRGRTPCRAQPLPISVRLSVLTAAIPECLHARPTVATFLDRGYTESQDKTQSLYRWWSGVTKRRATMRFQIEATLRFAARGSVMGKASAIFQITTQGRNRSLATRPKRSCSIASSRETTAVGVRRSPYQPSTRHAATRSSGSPLRNRSRRSFRCDDVSGPYREIRCPAPLPDCGIRSFGGRPLAFVNRRTEAWKPRY